MGIIGIEQLTLLLILLIIVISITIIVLFFSRDEFHEHKSGNFTEVTKLHKYIRIGIIIIMLLLIPFTNNIYALITGSFSLFLLIDAIMDWKHRRQSMEWILNLELSIFLALLFVYTYFYI